MTQQNQQMPQARVHVAHPYLALMGLYLGGFTGMYSETALNIALPQLSAAFGVDISLTQWLVVGYMLAIGIVLPFSSLLMKWFPARKLTVFALGAFFVGALISGFAPNFEIALAGRAVQGIGTGLVLPMMFAMVMEVIPPHKLGSAMGITALVIMFAPAIGPTLAGFLVGAASWRFIFFSFAVILAVGLVFALKFEVDPYELTRPHIDAASVVLSCLGFGGIVFGVGAASLFGWLSAPVIVALIVGVVCLLVYIKRQLGMKAPVLDLHAFGFQGFRVGAVCMMLNFGITLSAMYVLPQFYQNGMLLAVALTGIVMLPGGVVNALVSMAAGKVYDRIGARIPALAGFALSAIGAVMLMFATPETPLAYVICCHIIMMIGVPLAMSPCQTHALSSLPHRLSTDGSTILNTMQQVLGAVCTAIATNLLASGQQAFYAAGGTDSALAFTQGSHWGFIFTLVLAALGFVLATRIKKRSNEQPAPEASEPATAER
ncbi:MAG: MDR family MFS transporter [Eggerthellaceae bacterium]|nr:MDR family MFS transporter [Eggerthellaceae bacterium]